MPQSLKACPACGKQAGELVQAKASRFLFWVKCGACGWITKPVKRSYRQRLSVEVCINRARQRAINPSR